jgi:AcrR family transcriptional regulator
MATTPSTTALPAADSAQRRRTRRAIVDATARLLTDGLDPSVGDIAAAAEVSRRTVYLHFPTLDQLLLDATVGLMNVDVDAALERETSRDPRVRVTTLVDELYATMTPSLPLGRKLIKLTVDGPAPEAAQPRRGARRVRWLEWAVEPVRRQHPRRQHEDLVSALATVIGWESFIVLLDVRGLTPTAAHRVTRDAAVALVDAAISRGR